MGALHSAIEQSADRDLAQRDDELGAKFREFMASSNPMDQQIAATLGAALLGPVRRGAPALLANATCWREVREVLAGWHRCADSLEARAKGSSKMRFVRSTRCARRLRRLDVLGLTSEAGARRLQGARLKN